MDPQLDQIERDGASLKLEPRVMRLLVVLAEARGSLVEAGVLMDLVWPGLVVTSSSLYGAIAQLRRALGTDGGREVVVSVPRKGYRLAWDAGVPAKLDSIAVLPFRATSLPEDLDFLGESLTADLIIELSRQAGWLVVARGTMMTFAARTAAAADIGRQLGARFVVDGSIRFVGDVLEISVQVVDLPAGTQTWAETIQLPGTAWHGAARTVVARLARALQIGMLELSVQGEDLAEGPSARARRLAGRAWVELFARPETAATNDRAWQWAQQAHAEDPLLGMASICLATCCWRAAQFGWRPGEPTALLSEAADHAERAVELAPLAPDAHYVLGLVAYSLGETARAEESLRHCIRLSASFAPAYGLMALVRTRRGFPDEAGALCDQAFKASPREPLRAVWHLALAWSALALGDFRAALEQSQRSMAVNPDFPTCYLSGTAAAQALGLETLAGRWVKRLRERTVFTTLGRVRLRLPPATEIPHQQQMEALIDALRKAGLPE